ncbi:unnamed protein product [Caenorhabditis brenneri]
MQNDDAFLMTSEPEDDLVIEDEVMEHDPAPSPASTSNNISAKEKINEEMDHMLNTPWYNLSQDQAEIIHRLLVAAQNRRMDEEELRRSIESSLMELAMIRGRTAQVLPQN